jgi:co-chaperonin GroES (HSP10)
MQVNHAPSYEPIHKTSKVTPLHDNILVKDMNFSERTTAGGIILRSDDGKEHGVRPRWAEVYAVGPTHTDVKPGQWVYVEHGRWTRGVIIEDPNTGERCKLRKVDPECILLVSDETPDEI